MIKLVSQWGPATRDLVGLVQFSQFETTCREYVVYDEWGFVPHPAATFDAILDFRQDCEPGETHSSVLRVRPCDEVVCVKRRSMAEQVEFFPLCRSYAGARDVADILCFSRMVLDPTWLGKIRARRGAHHTVSAPQACIPKRQRKVLEEYMPAYFADGLQCWRTLAGDAIAAGGDQTSAEPPNTPGTSGWQSLLDACTYRIPEYDTYMFQTHSRQQDDPTEAMLISVAKEPTNHAYYTDAWL
ncbi:uncharacterized protein EDB91DRAFT_1079739 [Suillus paluster]|uniref:uncharacterized protein n=1 Tax=Suillus paluster TaxID=48578 RepID=UPI001B880BF0|nr:uncharacterized protein EDB91DRAFT_1079739 [Suillus paluster]KAG1747114.1 hypothetical protein EDB91DRAFT_1079739 [Suillus paluster]